MPDTITIDDEAGDMVSLLKDDTGIDNTIFVSTKGYVGSRHAPRIKIAIAPAHRFIAGGNHASMSIHDYSVRSDEDVSPILVRQMKAFIELNRQVLLDYWEGRIATRDLLNQVKPI